MTKSSPCSPQLERAHTKQKELTVTCLYYYNAGFPYSSVGKESACNARDPGSIPRSGRSPGEGKGNLLQYSCLENPMDR